MNFCKDCKHLYLTWWDRFFKIPLRLATCKVSPEDTGESLVTGPKKSGEYLFCSISRKFGPCGKDGALFEPKEK